MKHHIILSSLLVGASALSAPVMAQGYDGGPSDYVTTHIEDPALPDRLGNVTEAVMRAVLAMPVGPLADIARQVDPDSRVAQLPDDATVSDITHRDGRDVDHMVANARHAGAMAATMSRQLRVMMPVLQAMAGDLAAQWRDAGPTRR